MGSLNPGDKICHIDGSRFDNGAYVLSVTSVDKDRVWLETGKYTYMDRIKKVSDVTETVPGGSSDYYKLPEGAKELGDLIEHKDMNFNIGNIFKAAYRLGDKPGTDALYDLNKIKWFAEREIARHKQRDTK